MGTYNFTNKGLSVSLDDFDAHPAGSRSRVGDSAEECRAGEDEEGGGLHDERCGGFGSVVELIVEVVVVLMRMMIFSLELAREDVALYSCRLGFRRLAYFSLSLEKERRSSSQK